MTPIQFLNDILTQQLHLGEGTQTIHDGAYSLNLGASISDEQHLITTLRVKQNINNNLDLDNDKFQIFALLETLTGNRLSELYNSDAASYRFDFDSNHGTEPITYTCQITDYLS